MAGMGFQVSIGWEGSLSGFCLFFHIRITCYLLPTGLSSWPFLTLPDPFLFQDNDLRVIGLFYSKHYENIAGKDPSSLRPGGEWILTQGVAAHFPLSLLLPEYLV